MQTEPDRYSGKDIRFREIPIKPVSDERVSIHKPEWYRVRQILKPFVSEYSCKLWERRKAFFVQRPSQPGFCCRKNFFIL